MNTINQIFEIASKKGLSQHFLADACGTKQQNISKIKKGQRIPTLETVEKLCEAVGAELIVKDKLC